MLVGLEQKFITELLEEIKKKGPNAIDEKTGNTLLHAAVYYRQINAVELILSQPGVEVNQCNLKGLTPLGIAVFNAAIFEDEIESDDIVKLLLRHGAVTKSSVALLRPEASAGEQVERSAANPPTPRGFEGQAQPKIKLGRVYQFDWEQWLGKAFGLITLLHFNKRLGLVSSLFGGLFGFWVGRITGKVFASLRERFLLEIGDEVLKKLGAEEELEEGKVVAYKAGFESREWKGYFTYFVDLETCKNYPEYAAGLYAGTHQLEVENERYRPKV